MGKIEKLLALATEFKPGSDFKLRGMDAKVLAYSDEHMFLTVPEAAVDPDEVDVAGKRVRDREMESLKSENYRLNEEIRRLLSDERYFWERRERMAYEQRRRRDTYDAMDYMMRAPAGRAFRDPSIASLDIAPGVERWIDPLEWKQPSQKKR